MPARTSRPLSDFDPDRLVEDEPVRTSTVRWREPVYSHADVLVHAARVARTSRQELAAALLCATPADPKALLELVTTYRDRLVRDLGVPQPDNK